MGVAAARARARIEAAAAPTINPTRDPESDACIDVPDCGEEEGEREGPAQTQSETSIAVDSSGQHVVIGFNDFRGFALNPVTISGFMYSDDGGQTFTEGQLPSPGTDIIGTTRLPQVFGDPDVKYLGGCTFIYSSIIVKKFSATRAVQTLGVHRSTDCGHTWTGPFEVTSATNPHGAISTAGAPRDAADKELMSVDPDTGRVMVSWTNFTPFAPGSREISTTYSDNILATTPTWSARRIVSATVADGQGSIPAFAQGSSNAYMAWARFPSPGTFSGYGSTVGFARSTDSGQTWSAPMELSSEFFTVDQVLGNDRINTNPSMAVDNSGGAHTGSVYVVYSNNNHQDGGDVVFQRSTDDGLTFSAPLIVNSRPGNDRSQWFPWVTVDQSSGRIHVFYYDQGIAASGDLTQVTQTYSDDGGTHWVAPLPLSVRPFKAGWGNDGNEPNLGDYNQAVAQDGDLFAAFAQTSRPPGGFLDGQPEPSMTVPDVAFRKYRPAVDTEDFDGIKPTTLDLQRVTFVDSDGNGFLDPGEDASFTLALRNYVTNPLNAAKVVGIQARLSTTTPGVEVLQPKSNYDNLAPGAIGVNKKNFLVRVLPGFVPGTSIEFELDVQSGDFGSATLYHTQFTGTPVPTMLLSENFDGVAAGLLPPGWRAVHGGGVSTVPWTTSNTFCGASNAAFHANDNLGTSRTRWERLFSPLFAVPTDAEYLTVDFDVCYDTEEDPNFNILAYDGFFLSLFDPTPGLSPRLVFAEAFEDEFTTGSLSHYPKHFPRNSNLAYFADVSAWAGFSDGLKHVKMRLPGVAGSMIQLQFEYTQDSVGTCANVRPGHACGVMVDNVVVKSVKSQTP